MADAPLDALRERAHALLDRAYVPYSGQPVAAALLLSDGMWVPGVRVESAVYPLLVPALLAAYYAARCAGRTDVVAVAQTSSFGPDAPAFLSPALGAPFGLIAPDALAAEPPPLLPDPDAPLDPFLPSPPPRDDGERLALAAEVARRAHVPESGFPVGCVVETADGRLVPGCNVEHTDWTRGLCAERVALVTARSYGVTDLCRLTLVCPHAPGATPCGACRQALVEWAPGVPLVIGQGEAVPRVTYPEALLPGAFGGDALAG